MDPQNKANLKKLTDELMVMNDRLVQISEASHEDMEGADQPDFSISELLNGELSEAASSLRRTVRAVQLLADGKHWCQTHNREATHMDRGRHCCDPTLGGILAVCQVVP